MEFPIQYPVYRTKDENRIVVGVFGCNICNGHFFEYFFDLETGEDIHREEITEQIIKDWLPDGGSVDKSVGGVNDWPIERYAKGMAKILSRFDSLPGSKSIDRLIEIMEAA